PYLAGRTTRTQARVDVRRTALIGNTLQTLHGERTDTIGRTTLEAGYPMHGVTPYIAVTRLGIHQDRFAEHGGRGFGLTAPDQHRHATLGTLGVRIEHPFQWIGGHSMLNGYANWQHVLSGADMNFTAALTGAPKATFTAAGQS